ncbi:hypothetical protein ABFP60_03170 [Clostridioides difficile]
MGNKSQRNIWIVAGLGFSIVCIGRFSHEGFTFNMLLQGIVAILAFINVWIRHKRIKETQKKS